MPIFKGIGNVLKSVGKGLFRGVKDVLPIPQIGDSVKDLKTRQVLNIARTLKNNPSQNKETRKIVSEFLDILDDGKKNDSFDKAKAEMITRIFTGGLPVIAYLIYGITTGDWNAIFEIF